MSMLLKGFYMSVVWDKDAWSMCGRPLYMMMAINATRAKANTIEALIIIIRPIILPSY